MTVSIHFEGDPAVVRHEAAILFGLREQASYGEVAEAGYEQGKREAQAGSTDARDAAQTAVAEAATQEAPKRGRGRPAKNADSTPTPASGSEAAAAVAETIAAEATNVGSVPEPTAEVQAQDAADEAAESEGLFDEPTAPAAEPAKVWTADDLKAAMLAYQAKYGIPHAQSDLPGFIAEATAGAARKYSEVKPEQLGAVIAAVTAATDGNPHQRPVVA